MKFNSSDFTRTALVMLVVGSSTACSSIDPMTANSDRSISPMTHGLNTVSPSAATIFPPESAERLLKTPVSAMPPMMVQQGFSQVDYVTKDPSRSLSVCVTQFPDTERARLEFSAIRHYSANTGQSLSGTGLGDDAHLVGDTVIMLKGVRLVSISGASPALEMDAAKDINQRL